MLTTFLLILPVEVLHNIFDYLDTSTILHSLVCHLILPENLISRSLCENHRLRLSSSTSFVSWFQPDRFVRLRLLVLNQVPEYVMDAFVRHIHTGKLQSLTLTLPLPSGSSSAILLHDLSKSMSTPTPNLFQLDISNVTNAISYPLLPSVGSFLRSLVVNVCTYQEYCTILDCCTHLRTLELSNTIVRKSDQFLAA
jgi:hypothetical protein